MRRLLFALAFSNAWIALTAGGLALAAVVIGGWPLRWDAVVLPILSMFAVYTFDKVLGYDPVSDPENDPERSAFIARRGRPLLAGAVVGLVAACVVAARVSWLAVALVLLPIGVGIAYGFKLLPAGFRYRRLKDITGVKSLAVALAWGACCGLLPATLLGAPWDRAVWLLAAWTGMRLLINTVFFDLGDLEGDRAEGTVTIPVALGFGRTRALLVALAVFAWAAATGATLAGWLPARAHVVNLVALLELGYLAQARDEGADLGFACDVVADGVGLVAAALAGVALLTVG